MEQTSNGKLRYKEIQLTYLFAVFVGRNFIIFHPSVSNIIIHMPESHLQRKIQTISFLMETKTIHYMGNSKW